MQDYKEADAAACTFYSFALSVWINFALLKEEWSISGTDEWNLWLYKNFHCH